MTFYPHPARLLDPENAPPLLCTRTQRNHLLAALGVAGCLELPFGQELAETPAENFVEQLVQELPSLHSVSVGPNWTFGYKALGNAALLTSMGQTHGFEARIQPPVDLGGTIVSSTRIRQAIRTGNQEEATACLGRPFALSGVVVRGRQEGRTLGYPTANVQFEQEVHPAPGIYACEVRWKDEALHAAGYFMPGAVDLPHPFFEAHILDCSLDLYGQDLEVRLLKKIRDHQAFSCRSDLIDQIASDVQEVRDWFVPDAEG